MKCQILFSRKNKKNLSKCCLLIFYLPRMYFKIVSLIVICEQDRAFMTFASGNKKQLRCADNN